MKINKELAQKIWSAYNEIEKSEILKSDIEKTLLKDSQQGSDDYKLTNIFGENHRCQFSVPSGKNLYNLYYVNSTLALAVINQHIFDMRKKLSEFDKQISSEGFYAEYQEQTK